MHSWHTHRSVESETFSPCVEPQSQVDGVSGGRALSPLFCLHILFYYRCIGSTRKSIRMAKRSPIHDMNSCLGCVLHMIYTHCTICQYPLCHLSITSRSSLSHSRGFHCAFNLETGPSGMQWKVCIHSSSQDLTSVAKTCRTRDTLRLTLALAWQNRVAESDH